MNLNEAKFLIVDHFDSIKNQIDINTETLLAVPGLNDENKTILSNIRKNQLGKIEELQHASLFQLNKLSEKDFETEFTQLINDSSLDSDQKIERVLSRFILKDLILVENSKINSKQTLCILPGFLNKKNEKLIK